VKVLLAEDSGVIRVLLKQMLPKWGYEIVFAEDGEQAWRVLEGADSPRIALLDWMMPGPDGLEVCQRVRKAAREPRVYIILLTGRDQQEDVVRGLTAGADDYLRKPFDNAELEARIRTGRRIVELEDELAKVREALHRASSKR
jgi:DNA-binding response OmpR family regulator